MYRIFLAYLFLLSAVGGVAQNRLSDNLDSLFQYCYKQNIFNGHVLVYSKGEIKYNTSFGTLDADSIDPISNHTPFLLASLSKQFTAVAIIYLKSQGLLEYDDPVKRYYPDFPYPNITIRQLLNHTSGLPEYTELLSSQYKRFEEDFANNNVYLTSETIVHLIQTRVPELDFEPGTSFYYSNTGYVFLAKLIERISAKAFSEFMNDTFFEPLELKNTWVIDEDLSTKKNRAIGYEINPLTKKYKKNELLDFFRVYGDGGIYSSARDLLKWFRAMDEGKVIPPSELAQAYARPVIEDKKLHYCFGWFVRELPFNQHTALTHSGQFAGFTNSIFRDLDGQITAIVLSNNSHQSNPQINKALVKIIYGLPFEYPKISASILIGNTIIQEGIGTAKEYYWRHKDNAKYDFSEKSMNKLGYELMGIEKYKEAIEILEWNVERFPNSPNVYDSLAEAYLKLGNEEEAIKYFDIAYKMDPSNTNAKEIIDVLTKS